MGIYRCDLHQPSETIAAILPRDHLCSQSQSSLPCGFRPILILITLSATALQAQAPAAPLVTQPIDEAKLVTLRGNVHPLAQPRYDVGAVPDSLPAKRILLLLNRPADRETALQQFMKDVHTPGSASYRQWLTPQQFGERFGPADSDIQQVSDWLSGMGLQVAGS
jgi:subtilase family serine protease